MSSIGAIALSGLSAASLRLEVAASNVANASSSGPLPGATASGTYPPVYAAQRVEQTAGPGGATRATVVPASPPTVTAWQPDAPFADGRGQVAMPNVDLADQAVQLVMARLSFAANAQMLKADAGMTKMAINLMA